MSSVTKKNKKVQVAYVCINATFNNTIITFTDLNGNVLCWSSSGKSGFNGSRRGTPHAASVATDNVGKIAINEFGVKSVSVILKGPGAGRESSVRSLHSLGLKITVLKDVTGIPYNGCRPPKRRRV